MAGLTFGSEGLDMRLWSSVLLAVVLIGAAWPADADEGPRADIAGGYSLIYDHDTRTTFEAGWFFSPALNITNRFAIAAELSGHYKSLTPSDSLRVHTFLGGPRFISGTGAARFYGEFLVGGAVFNGNSATDLCYLPAIGLDIGFNPRAAMRIGAGERFIQVAGGTTKQFQFVAGLVFRFEK